MQIIIGNGYVFARLGLVVVGLSLGCATSSAVAGSPIGEPSLQPRVKLVTTVGDIVLELDASEAPNAALSFVKRVEANHYNGLVFHRVLKGRLIQSGAYTPDMVRRIAAAEDTDVLDFDNVLRNRRGTISAVKESEWNNRLGAGFFINVADNFQFDEPEGSGPYPVFGHVIEGMELVDQISNVAVKSHPDYAAGLSPFVPTKAIVIKSAKMLSPLDKEAARTQAQSLQHEAEYEANAGQRELKRLFDIQVEKIKKAIGKDVTLTKSGLVVGDVRIGVGHIPTMDDKVLVNFRGFLLDGTTLTDTYDKDPIERKVSDFIEGVRIALTTMKEGGKRMIIVPPDLGFGTGGATSIGVPPNAFIAFDLELLEIRSGDDD